MGNSHGPLLEAAQGLGEFLAGRVAKDSALSSTVSMARSEKIACSALE